MWILGSFDYIMHNGTEVFRSIIDTPAVKALVEESSLVIPRKDLKDSRQEHFKAISRVVNTSSYAHLGLRSSDSQPLTFTINKLSRFVKANKETQDASAVLAFKGPLFTFLSSEDSESPSKLLAYATAPKLSKDCHKLPRLLAGKTMEVPDTLRTEDHEIRQVITTLILTHESAKYSSNITADVILKCLARVTSSELVEQHVKSVERLNNSCIIPATQNLITYFISQAKQIRYEARSKAVAETKPFPVKASLREGGCFSLGLFDENAIRITEDCATTSPPVVNLFTPSFARPYRPRGRGQTTYPQRVLTRGLNTSFRGRGRGACAANYSSTTTAARGQQRSRGVQRGSYCGAYTTTNYNAPTAPQAARGAFRGTHRGRGAATQHNRYQAQ